jgi:hypothetical protein
VISFLSLNIIIERCKSMKIKVYLILLIPVYSILFSCKSADLLVFNYRPKGANTIIHSEVYSFRNALYIINSRDSSELCNYYVYDSLKNDLIEHSESNFINQYKYSTKFIGDSLFYGYSVGSNKDKEDHWQLMYVFRIGYTGSLYLPMYDISNKTPIGVYKCISKEYNEFANDTLFVMECSRYNGRNEIHYVSKKNRIVQIIRSNESENDTILTTESKIKVTRHVMLKRMRKYDYMVRDRKGP